MHMSKVTATKVTALECDLWFQLDSTSKVQAARCRKSPVGQRYHLFIECNRDRGPSVLRRCLSVCPGRYSFGMGCVECALEVLHSSVTVPFLCVWGLSVGPLDASWVTVSADS